MSAEGSVVTIFKKYGWGWGGDWDSPQRLYAFDISNVLINS